MENAKLKLNFDLLNQVIQVAHQAGQEVMRHYNKVGMKCYVKSDASPVTQADWAADTLIQSGLQKINAWHYVSEESLPDLAMLDDDTPFWLVDPLDGTKEFIQQSDEFTINIALVYQGLSRLGVVHAPARNLTYAAFEKGGAYRYLASQQKRICCSIKSQVAKSSLAVSRSHLGEQDKLFIKNSGIENIVPLGSSLKYCYIAEGVVDASIRYTPLMSWDLAASACIVKEAGGWLSNFAGEPLVFETGTICMPLNSGLVSSNFHLHAPLLKYF